MNIPAERYPLYDRIILFLFVVVAPFALGSNPAIFNDGDVSWHIATGRWILENGIPSTDPFSHTMAGKAWVAHEWLPDVAFGAAYNGFGYPGVAALVVLALLLLHGILFAFLRPRVGPLAVLLSLLAVAVVLGPFTLARPHVLVWPVLAAWTAALIHFRDAGRAPPLGLATVMLLWTNMHGSFPIGLFIAACVALDALNANGWERSLLIRWMLFGLASTVCVLLNANGVAGLLYPFETLGMETLTKIQEWLPSTPALTPQFYVVMIAVLGIVILRGASLRLGEALMLLLLLGMAFQQVRHQTWLAIAAAFVLTPRLASQRPASGQIFPAGWTYASRAGLVCAAIAGIIVIRLAMPVLPNENRFNPRSLIAHVPAELRSQPVFNEYSFGGPLILAGIRPYIDGRADMFGDEFILDYRAIIGGDKDRFDKVVRQYGIRWSIIPRNSPLAAELEGDRSWTKIYSEKTGVIYRRSERS